MKFKALAALLSATLLLGGCASTSCVVLSSNPAKNENTNLGSGLLGSVSITPAATKLAGDMLYAKVAFFNKTNTVQNIQYQFQWLGVDGFNQGNATPMIPVELGPNMSKVVTTVAPTPETTQFTVNVCYK
jgi:uncharacterized protein YcfL